MTIQNSFNHRRINSGAVDLLLKILSIRKGAVGIALLAIVVICSIFAPFIAPYDPIAVGSGMDAGSLQPPSALHLLGTDILGRDIFSRLVFGSRISLSVAVITVFFSLIVGSIIGVVAGFYRGLIDSFLMRLTDIVLSFPMLVGALLVLVVIEPGIFAVSIVISLFSWPMIARLMRSKVLGVREKAFVESARMAGASNLRIITKHILPHSMGPVLVATSLAVAQVILTEASLSFFGIGIAPPTPDWGYMVFEGRKQMFTAPWLVLFPGLAIMITVLAFVFISDALNGVISRDSRRGI